MEGVAPGRYALVSEPYVSDDFEGLRRAVSIEFSRAKVAETVELGTIGVDRARIGAFDVDAVAQFNTEEATDGKADIVFWGLHEQEVAKRFDAPAIEGTGCGFEDLPFDRALAIGQQLDALRNTGELRFAFDFRPHTDDYALLACAAPSRSPPTMRWLRCVRSTGCDGQCDVTSARARCAEAIGPGGGGGGSGNGCSLSSLFARNMR